IRDHPTSPLAAEANLDLARILVQQAKAKLHKAKLEDGGQSADELRRIRGLFADAGKRLRVAATQIALAAAKSNDPAIAQAKSDAELELAVNLLDQMMTFSGDTEVERRVDVGKQALDALKKLANLDDKNRAAWLARAWL